jgi:hypothetical protein
MLGSVACTRVWVLELSGAAAAVGELGEQLCCLHPVAVAQDGVDLAPRCVEMDAGEAQRALDGAFEQPDALHLGEGYPIGHSLQTAAGGERISLVGGASEVVVAQRRLPAGAGRRPLMLGGRARQHPGDQVGGLLAAAHRQQRAGRIGLVAVLAPLGLLAGDVDFQPAPSERPPGQRLDHPDSLDPSAGDRLG